MDHSEIMDSLAHEFLLTRIRQEVSATEDIESLREMIVQLVDLNEVQKATFKNMLYTLMECGEVHVELADGIMPEL